MFHEVSKQTRMNQKKTYGGRFMRQNNNGRLYGKMRKKGKWRHALSRRNWTSFYLSLWVLLPGVVFYRKQILSLQFHKGGDAYAAHSDEA